MTISYQDLPAFPGYRVGNDGSVWSCKNNKWNLNAPWRRLATKININGYESVGLWRNNHRALRLVETLVLEAFVGPRPEGFLALHRNDNRLDNRLDNLYWGTKADNIRDAQENARLQGPNQSTAKATVQAIRLLADQGLSQGEIAVRVHIPRGTVRAILRQRRRARV